MSVDAFISGDLAGVSFSCFLPVGTKFQNYNGGTRNRTASVWPVRIDRVSIQNEPHPKSFETCTLVAPCMISCMICNFNFNRLLYLDNFVHQELQNGIYFLICYSEFVKFTFYNTRFRFKVFRKGLFLTDFKLSYTRTHIPIS